MTPIVSTKNIRTIEADYLSALKIKAEEQQNQDKYSDVNAALSDFNNRLNLQQTEKRVLASFCKANNLSTESLKEEIAKGAPVSILPGVKPSKETNKIKVREDLADNSTSDLGNTKTSQEKAPKVIFAEENPNQKQFEFNLEFEFEIETGGKPLVENTYINFILDHLPNHTFNLTVQKQRGQPPTKNSKPLSREAVVSFLDKIAFNINNISPIESEIAPSPIPRNLEELATPEDKAAQEALNERIPLDFKKKQEKLEALKQEILATKEKGLKDLAKIKEWLLAFPNATGNTPEQKSLTPSSVSESSGLKQIQPATTEDEDSDLGVFDDISGPSEPTLLSKNKSRTISVDKFGDKIKKTISISLFSEEVEVDKDYQEAEKKRKEGQVAIEQVGVRLQKTLQYKKPIKQISQFLEAIKKVRPSTNLTNIQQVAETLKNDGIEFIQGPQDKINIDSIISFLKLYLSTVKRLCHESKISETDPNILEKLQGLAGNIENTIQSYTSQLEKHEAAQLALEEDVSLLGEQHQLQLLNNYLSQRLPSLLSSKSQPSGKGFLGLRTVPKIGKEELTKKVEILFEDSSKDSSQRQEELTRISTALGNNKFGKAIVDKIDTLTSSEFSEDKQHYIAIAKALYKYSGFLMITPEVIEKAYQEQLQTKAPIVPRKKNQIRHENIEYVTSLDGKRKYRGALPPEELIRASDTLLYGEAINPDLSSQSEATEKALEVLKIKRAKIIEFLSSKYSKQYEAQVATFKLLDKDPQATSVFKKRAEELQTLLPPELRPYGADIPLPPEKVATKSLILNIILNEISGLQDNTDLGSVGAARGLYLPTLERKARLAGYALDSYDSTIADNINDIYFSQMAEFVKETSSRKNAYISLHNSAIRQARASSQKEVNEVLGKDPSKEDILALEDFLALFENNIQILAEQSALESKKSVIINKSEELDGEAKKAVEKALNTALDQVLPITTEQQADINSPIRKKREQFRRIVKARTKNIDNKDVTIVNQEKRGSNLDIHAYKSAKRAALISSLGDLATKVFSSTLEKTNNLIVTPSYISEYEISPQTLRDQIRRDAQTKGYTPNKWQTNRILRDILHPIWSKGKSSTSSKYSLEELLSSLGEDEIEETVLKKYNLNFLKLVKDLEQSVLLFDKAPVLPVELANAGSTLTALPKDPLSAVNKYQLTIRLPEVSIIEGETEDDEQQRKDEKDLIESLPYECWVGSHEQLKQQLNSIKIDPVFEEMIREFPTSPEEEMELRRKGLSDTSRLGEVAYLLDSTGIVKGIKNPILLFKNIPQIPEDLGKDGIAFKSISENPQASVQKFSLSIPSTQETNQNTNLSYECWVGTNDNLKLELSSFKKQPEMGRATLNLIEDNGEIPVVDQFKDALSDAKFLKWMHKQKVEGAEEQLVYNLKDLGFTPAQFQMLWDKHVLGPISSNTYKIEKSQGLPRTSWGKSGMTFVKESNSIKMGKKKDIYTAIRRETEKAARQTFQEKEVEKRKKIVQSQIHQLGALLTFISNTNPSTISSLPQIETFLESKNFSKQSLKQLQKLFAVIEGKEKIQSKSTNTDITQQQAVDLVIKYCHDKEERLLKEKDNLDKGGIQSVMLELVCPMVHERRSFSTRVQYLAKDFLADTPKLSFYSNSNKRSELIDDSDSIDTYRRRRAQVLENPEVEDWANSVLSETELSAEARSWAQKTKGFRYVIVGNYPTCPHCGLKFINLDSEISNQNTKSNTGQRISRRLPYLREFPLENVDQSLSWICKQLTWLSNPSNSGVPKEKAPFTVEDIKNLPIAQADLNGYRTPANEHTYRKKGVNTHQLIRILTDKDDQDTTKQWQSEVYDILNRWKQDLIGTFDRDPKQIDIDTIFKTPVDSRKSPLSEIEQQKLVAFDTETKQGVVVGTTSYTSDNVVAYKDDEEHQISHLFIKGPEIGKVQTHGSLKIQETRDNLKKRGTILEKLFEILNTPQNADLSVAIQDLIKPYTEIQSAVQNISNIVFPIPKFKRMGEQEIAVAEQEFSFRKQFSSYLLSLLSGKNELKISFLSFLQRLFPGFTNSQDWADSLNCDESSIYTKIIQAYPKQEEIDSTADAIIDQLVSSKGSFFDEDIQGNLNRCCSLMKEASLKETQFLQERYLKDWDWLKGRFIRVKKEKSKSEKIELSTEAVRTLQDALNKDVNSEFSQIPDGEIVIENEDDLRNPFKFQNLIEERVKELKNIRKNYIHSFANDLKARPSIQDPAYLETLNKEIDLLIPIFEGGIEDISNSSNKDSASIADRISKIFSEKVLNNKQEQIKTLSTLVSRINSIIAKTIKVKQRISTTIAVHVKHAPLTSAHPYFFYKVADVIVGTMKESIPDYIQLKGGKYIGEDIEELSQSEMEAMSPDQIKEEKERIRKQKKLQGKMPISMVRQLILQYEQSDNRDDDTYKVLVRLYTEFKATHPVYNPGDLILVLHPIVKENDYYKSSFETKATKDIVPINATKQLKYKVPLSLLNSVRLGLCQTPEEVAEVYNHPEVGIKTFFDFADLHRIGDSTTSAEFRINKIKRAKLLRRIQLDIVRH